MERNASDAAKVTELVEYIEELEAKLFEREERWLYLSEKAEQIEKIKKADSSKITTTEYIGGCAVSYQKNLNLILCPVSEMEA